MSARMASALWISLSIGALMLAGFLSIFIMLGRTPIIYEHITDPHWFRRTLVVHVVLALLVWFHGFLCGLFVLIPLQNSENKQPIAGYLSAVTGVVLITISIFITSADPVLSNYIPILDHPVFIIGILFFGGGVGLTLFNKRLLTTGRTHKKPAILPASAIPGLQSAAVLFLISLVVFVAAWLITPKSYHTETYYEFIIWGGGHLLQFVNIATVVAVWMLLLKKLIGRNPIPYKWSALLFFFLTLPVIASPLLLLNGTSDSLYLTGFSRYMQWGIFPVISVFILLITALLIRAKNRHNLPSNLIWNPYFNGLAASILFIILSFILGALIRGPNTMVPAHYHASLGGITIAFMVAAYLLMDFYHIPPAEGKVKKWSAIQPLLFGVGQLIFVSGLAYAGAYGLARKAFGTEQQISSAEVYTGLGLLFVGGSLAIAGGMLFFWIVVKRWQAYHTHLHESK
jgi:hypothetical protein